MVETKTNEATRNLVKSVQETTRAIVDTSVTTQEHNLAFARHILESSIEVLKSHAESNRALMQDLAERARKQPMGAEEFQALVDSIVAAQGRNTRFAVSIFENGVEALKSQASIAQSLLQDLSKQFQKQQEVYQALTQQSIDMYMDYVFAPFTFWQRAFSVAETAATEGMKRFQKATEEGLEAFQKASEELAPASEKSARQPQTTARKSAN